MAIGFGDPRASLAKMTTREIAEELLLADTQHPGCHVLLSAGEGKTYRLGFIGSIEAVGGRKPDMVLILEDDKA